MTNLYAWLAKAPPWLGLGLAILAVLTVVQLYRLWAERRLDPRNLKAVLIPACTVALVGSAARHVPAAAVRFGDSAVQQMELFSYLASAIAVVVALVEAQKLRGQASQGYGVGGQAGFAASDPTIPYRPTAEGLTSGGSAWAMDAAGSSAASAAGPEPMTSFDRGAFAAPGPSSQTVLRRPSARQAQVAWLSALSGPHAGQTWSLGDETHLGRGEKDPCEIVLSDPTVSGGRHALIRLQEDGRYLLADLASTNGTFVNGERIMRHVLGDRDRITLGASELVFMQANLAATDSNSPEGEKV